MKRIISISILFGLLISIYRYAQAVENNPAKAAEMQGIGLGVYSSIVFDSLPSLSELEGNGWFLQTRSLAYIKGNENSIDIIFKSTLPGDSLYGRVERYEADEIILSLSYDGSELISTWHALRREHPVLIECEEEIKGNYFKKIA